MGSPIPIDIAAQATANTANMVQGTAMGLMLEKHNDARQRRQQRKLQEIQIAGSKELTDYNFAKSLEQWKATNYGAQMEEIKKAGLNPGLLYGMGGAGGATTAGSAGNVTGANAPTGGGEIMGLMAQNLNLRMMNAQIENLKADTQKKEAEATKTAGVDTELAKSQISLNNANTGNTEVDTKLKELQIKIDQQHYNFTAASYDDALGMIHENYRKAMGEATSALVKGNIDTNTRTTIENTIKAQYVGQLLENTLLRSQNEKIKSDIKVNNAQITKWATELQQGWQGLTLQEKAMKVDGLMKEVEQFYKGTLGHLRTHDPFSTAKQIDQILGLEKEDFKK